MRSMRSSRATATSIVNSGTFVAWFYERFARAGAPAIVAADESSLANIVVGVLFGSPIIRAIVATVVFLGASADCVERAIAT